MGLNIKPLEGAGAEITGIDIKSLSDDDFAAVKQAYADHGVIFFRDQNTSEEDHIAFASRFSSININRFFAAHPEYPQIALVAKDKDQKDNIGGGWHTDHSYDEEPAMGSMLVARELPETGGDTLFASMYAAYDALPDDLKAAVEGKSARHSAKHIFGAAEESYYSQIDAGTDGRIGNADATVALKDPIHPIIITHPLSGKKAVYVNPAFTVAIEGMEKAESDELLQKLYAHTMNMDFVHRFKWKPGSIAFWDNRATWHWAMNDYHGQRRVMHRITLDGGPLAA